MAKGAALITGASSGIGAELARLCAADGYAVILVARRADRLAELAENLAREYGVPARVHRGRTWRTRRRARHCTSRRAATRSRS